MNSYYIVTLGTRLAGVQAFVVLKPLEKGRQLIYFNILWLGALV